MQERKKEGWQRASGSNERKTKSEQDQSGEKTVSIHGARCTNLTGSNTAAINMVCHIIRTGFVCGVFTKGWEGRAGSYVAPPPCEKKNHTRFSYVPVRRPGSKSGSQSAHCRVPSSLQSSMRGRRVTPCSQRQFRRKKSAS